jgi:hypothetical protein
MTTIADGLREVLSEERLNEPRVRALLVWAEPFGDDLGAAWTACPRADHLVLLAGAFQVPAGALVRAAGRALRPIAALAPRPQVPQVTRAVYAAEQHGGPTVKPLGDLPQALRRSARKLRQAEESQSAAAAGVTAFAALLRGPAARVRAALSEGLSAGEALEAEVTAALSAPEARGEVRAVADALRRAQSAQSATLALLACGALGQAVVAARTVVDTLVKLSRLGDGAISPDAVRALAHEADALESSLYDALAQALSFASEAAARAAAARWATPESAGFFDTLGRTALEASLHAAERPGEPPPTLSLHRDIERVIAAERLGWLKLRAEELKAAVPAPTRG